MKRMIVVLSLFCLAVFGVSQALADEVDMSQYTCEDLLSERESDVLILIFWIDGYMSGKTGDMKVDSDALSNLAEKLITHCSKNKKALILKAVQGIKGKY